MDQKTNSRSDPPRTFFSFFPSVNEVTEVGKVERGKNSLSLSLAVDKIRAARFFFCSGNEEWKRYKKPAQNPTVAILCRDDDAGKQPSSLSSRDGGFSRGIERKGNECTFAEA